MNGGGLLPVKAGMQQSSHYVFKQSGLRVWDVLQIMYTTCKRRCLGSLILAKRHALLRMMTTNCSRFCTWRGSSIMIRWSVPAVSQWDLVYFIKMTKQSWCHIQGSVLLSHTIWWYTISDTWKVQYRSRYHGWEYRGVSSPLQRPTKALTVQLLGDGEDHDTTINSSNIVGLPPCPAAYARWRNAYLVSAS